ncbi:MAG: histidinol-phosphate transaminase [Methanomassiliicoccales archaeon]
MEEWMRSTLEGIERYYNPEIRGKVRMDTSTNVLGPNPAAREVMEECLDLDVNQYPRPYSDELREALGEFYGLSAENIIAGNGSDEILDIIFKSFLNWGETAVMPYPTYSLHPYFVRINGGDFTHVDLTPEFQLDPDALLSVQGKILILCTPNNPTGNTFRREDVEELIDQWGGPVVVDEAYGEFAGESFIPLVEDYPNLIVTRTFSKAYGMAGMRVGYLASSPEMVEIMIRSKIPYSLNRISELMALAALRRQDFVERVVSLTDRERPRLADSLQRLGFDPFPTKANFMLARCPVDSGQLTAAMDRRGVLIRDFGDRRMLENCVRTTIGTEELNGTLVENLKEVLERWH